jgi:uncharacterized protein (DUF983 family)
MVGNTLATGRLPQLGNAEFGFLILAHIVAILVVLFSNTITITWWWDFFKWTSIVYILSRGVAKASRVFEQ